MFLLPLFHVSGSGGIEEHAHDHGPSSKHHHAPAAAQSPKSGRGVGGRAAAAPMGSKSPLSPKTKKTLQQQQQVGHTRLHPLNQPC